MQAEMESSGHSKGIAAFGLAAVLLALSMGAIAAFDSGIALVLALAGVLLALAIIVLRYPFWGMMLLVWGVPFHTLMLAGLVSLGSIPEPAIDAFKFWRVALVILLLLALFQKGQHTYRVTWLDVSIGLFIGVEAVYLLLPTGAPSWSAKLFALQTDSTFLLFYLLGRLFPYSYRQFRRIVLSIVALGWATAALALLERLFFPGWLFRLGAYFAYLGKDISRHLPAQFYTFIGGTPMQRPGSIYLNPIEFSFAAVVSLALTWGLGLHSAYRPTRRLWLGLLLLLAALSLALSRGAILGVAVGLGFVVLIRPRMPRWFLLAAGGLVVLAAILFAVLRLDQLLLDTIQVAEPSAAAHLERWRLSLETIEQAPLGLGLGSTGPAALRFIGRDALVSESWYFQIAIEMGIPTGLLFVLIMALLVWQGIRIWNVMPDRFLRGVVLGFVAATMALITASLFLHTWAYDAVAFPFWMLAGLIMQLPARTRLADWLPKSGQ
jgi:hypothetical protein